MTLMTIFNPAIPRIGPKVSEVRETIKVSDVAASAYAIRWLNCGRKMYCTICVYFAVLPARTLSRQPESSVAWLYLSVRAGVILQTILLTLMIT